MSRSMSFFLVGIAPLMVLGLAYLGLATISANPMGWFLLFMGLAYLIGGPLYLWKRKCSQSRPMWRKRRSARP